MFTAPKLLVANLVVASISLSSFGKDSEYVNSNPGLMNGGHIDSGMIIGKLVVPEEKGLIFKSWELSINIGDLGTHMPNKYDTTTFAYSTLEKRVFEETKKLDLDKVYVFKYNKSVMINPFTRATGYNITDILPSKLGERLEDSGLPTEYVDKASSQGSYSVGVAQGLIVKVQRWGRFSTSCAITLNLGGRKSAVRTIGENAGYKSILNTSKLVLNTEEGCKFAENILPYGQEVQINFSQAVVNVFNYTKVAHSIKIKK